MGSGHWHVRLQSFGGFKWPASWIWVEYIESRRSDRPISIHPATICCSGCIDPQTGRHWDSVVNIIYVLIPLSIILMILALVFFFWAVRNGQFDDLDTPALDVLDDDREPIDSTDESSAARDDAS